LEGCFVEWCSQLILLGDWVEVRTRLVRKQLTYHYIDVYKLLMISVLNKLKNQRKE